MGSGLDGTGEIQATGGWKVRASADRERPSSSRTGRVILRAGGRYTADIILEGQAYAIVMRSPHAQARINSVDTQEARAAPGVLGAYTSADLIAAGLGTIPCLFPVEQKDGSPMVAPPRPLSYRFTSDGEYKEALMSRSPH